MAKKQLTRYNPETKTMEVMTKDSTSKEGRYKISVNESSAQKLLGFGDADGIDRSADTDAGKKVRATAVVRQYAQIAIDEFISAREAAEKAAAEEPDVAEE